MIETGTNLPKVKPPRIRHLFQALIFAVLLVWFLLTFRAFFYPLLFGAVFGYILQRSRFCFAGSFRDIFLIRNTTLTRAVLLSLALTTAGFSLVGLLSGGVSYLETHGLVHPAGFNTVVGGVLFGFGMVIAGACVSGCLVRMGEGYVMQYYTFAGLLAGSALGAWNWCCWNYYPKIFLPHHLGWFQTVLLQLFFIGFLYLLALRYERGQWPVLKWPAWPGSRSFPALFRSKSWSYTTGAVLIAVSNILLFYFWERPWGISSGLAHFSGWILENFGFNPSRWTYFSEVAREKEISRLLDYPLVYLALAMVIGSLISTLLHGEFRWRLPANGRYVIAALVGGVLMGYSSRLVMGCNIGGYLGAVSSLSLHGWLFGIFILLGAFLGGKFLMRYLV